MTPELVGETELAGFGPAAFGHEGMDREIVGEIFAEFQTGVDTDAAD